MAKNNRKKINKVRIIFGIILLVAGIAAIAIGAVVHGGVLLAGSGAALKLLV